MIAKLKDGKRIDRMDEISKDMKHYATLRLSIALMQKELVQLCKEAKEFEEKHASLIKWLKTEV